MATSSLRRPLGITAAILGITQGIAWAILGFLTILIHFEAWTPETPPIATATYGQLLNSAILDGYINGKGPTLDVFIKAEEFYIWAIIYLITSLLWIGISCFLIYVLIKKKHHLLRKALLGWALWTTSISFCDLLLMSLLASDYHVFVKTFNESTGAVQAIGSYSVLACGIMMTLAAKGFVLWIVNVLFDGIIIKFFIDISKETNGPSDSSSDLIQGFGGMHFASDDAPSRPKLGRSNSFTSTSFGTFAGLPRLPPIQSTNERLANLGRYSVRSRTTSTRANESGSYSPPYRAESTNYSMPNVSSDRPQQPALRRY